MEDAPNPRRNLNLVRGGRLNPNVPAATTRTSQQPSKEATFPPAEPPGRDPARPPDRKNWPEAHASSLVGGRDGFIGGCATDCYHSQAHVGNLRTRVQRVEPAFVLRNHGLTASGGLQRSAKCGSWRGSRWTVPRNPVRQSNPYRRTSHKWPLLGRDVARGPGARTNFRPTSSPSPGRRDTRPTTGLRTSYGERRQLARRTRCGAPRN